MAKSKANTTGPALVIVESPAKAKTIGKYLGPGYVVEASVGHIRDLPQRASQIAVGDRKKSWANLGVNVEKDFEPYYVVPDDKKKQVSKLKSLLKNASTLYLATDEDREGEAISWHLAETLNPNVPYQRLVFHEITKDAILKALGNTRDINLNLVHAQEARRILDRLYGYETSPILWRKIKSNLSAGRVQSVAMRLVVERERERISFQSAEYWDVLGEFAPVGTSKGFQAPLEKIGDKAIPDGKNFESTTGKLKNPAKFALLDEKSAGELVSRLKQFNAVVESVEEKPHTTHPGAPFTTSMLQQEANRKLGFTAKKTMSVAQSLYENGYITYMRTDSTVLSQEAINAARELIETHYGAEYLPEKPNFYVNKVKNAQEAHEAIRPAGSRFPLPDELRAQLSNDEYRLYDMIWKRTIASQMTNARGKKKTVVVAVDDAFFKVGGKTIEFPGYLRAYVEGKDDPDAELADQERYLPDVQKGDRLDILALTPQGHTTQPAARYTEASLTKTLEDLGIGRPSTYASIIEVIQNRSYVFKKNGALVPTWIAFAVCHLLETHFPELVDYSFTADMENALDEISNGKRDEVSYLKAFYFGETEDHAGKGGDAEFPFPATFEAGLKRQIDAKLDEIDARAICQFLVGTPVDANGKEGAPVYVRVGRYGAYLEQDGVTAPISDDLPPDETTLEKALEILHANQNANTPIGTFPETGEPIYLKNGRFGWYVQLGDGEDGGKPRYASLLKGMSENDVTYDVAVQLLSLPKTLGVDPGTSQPVIASNGRFGPYVKRGTDTRSIPAGLSPLSITLEQALELLAQEKTRGRAAAKKTEPLKTFGVSPVTEQEIKLLDGRYGPYVTDGATNASLPRDLAPEELTAERALELLAARAARGGTTRRKTTKKATVKKTATVKKSAAAKKTTKKATTAKKTAKKASKSNKDAPF